MRCRTAQTRAGDVEPMSYIDNYQECVAEQIDGSYDCENCGCPECRQETAQRIDNMVEDGTISETEAYERHVKAGTL
jgi:hypothetical protein